MVLVELVPCIALSPVLGAIANQKPNQPHPVRWLRASGVVDGKWRPPIALGLPTAVMLVLAPLTSLGFTMTRPPQAALMPAIVRSPMS